MKPGHAKRRVAPVKKGPFNPKAVLDLSAVTDLRKKKKRGGGSAPRKAL